MTEQATGDTEQSLHERYEPEAPIHHAVNITTRRLKDRLELVEHDEYDLWKAEDPETGRMSDSWWREPETAIKFLASSISNDTCCVNECMTHLGEDTDRVHCDDHDPTEYIECAEEDCDFPTHHTETDYCSSHTWRNGRSIDTSSE